MNTAEQAKEKGNESIKIKDFAQAAQHYTDAINLDSTQSTYFSNRALAYIQLGKYEDALKDSEKAIQLAPNVWRGHQRKAQSLHGLKRETEAVESFQAALKLDPNNAQLKAGLEESLQAAASSRRGAQTDPRAKQAQALQEIFSNDPIALCKSIPDIAHLATERSFCNKLEEIQRDFSKLNTYIQNDEKVMQFVSVALQYQQIAKMSPEEREQLMKREAEMRMRQQKEEDQERERKRKAEKDKKEQESKKAKEEEESRLTTEQKEAIKLKDEANALYNAKKFPEALALYDKAIEKDPTNINFYNNKAACYLTMKDFDACIEVSKKGLEAGENSIPKAPFEKTALSMQRIGNSLLQKGELEESITFLKKSLLNDRNSKTLQLLQIAEKALEEKKKQEYISPELSNKAKEEGNNFFKLNKYPEAVKCYSEAILRDPTNHVNYSNRAAAYIKLLALPEALKDSEKCIEINPKFVKGYIRKGTAQFLMKDFRKCLETYQLGIELEPNNPELIAGIQKAVAKINQGGQDEETVRKNVENDPELQNILRDPVMRQVLEELREDPKKAQGYLKDPTIRANLDKLVSAGIVSFQ